MRWIALLLVLLPLSAMAEEQCPVGFSPSAYGLCTPVTCKTKPPRCKRGEVLYYAQCPAHCGPACPDDYYFEPSMKLCAPVCPDGGKPVVGDQGDIVCRLPESVRNAERYAAICRAHGREFIPRIGLCGPELPSSGGGGGTPTDGTGGGNCPAGQLVVRESGKYRCKKGSVQQVLDRMQERLEKSGLTYLEYLKELANAQTNIGAMQMLESRIAQVEREAKEGGKKKPDEKSVCAAGYVPNPNGGCRPEKSCNYYRCKDGSVPEMRSQGRNYYCACDK